MSRPILFEFRFRTNILIFATLSKLGFPTPNFWATLLSDMAWKCRSKFVSELWRIHPFAEGNTLGVSVKTIERHLKNLPVHFSGPAKTGEWETEEIWHSAALAKFLFHIFYSRLISNLRTLIGRSEPARDSSMHISPVATKPHFSITRPLAGLSMK